MGLGVRAGARIRLGRFLTKLAILQFDFILRSRCGVLSHTYLPLQRLPVVKCLQTECEADRMEDRMDVCIGSAT